MVLITMALLLFAVAGAEEPSSDPMWRSRWTFSFGAGASPVTGYVGYPGECVGEGCATGPTTTFASAVVADGLVAFATGAGATSFELGPQVLVRLVAPSWFGPDATLYAPTLEPQVGLHFGVRFRPNPPPAPGEPSVFEWGLRATLLGGPSFGTFAYEGLGEWWGGWSLPAGSPSTAPGTRPVKRTALVLGPFVRGGGGLRAIAGAVWRLEAGLRVDIRRETRTPPTP